ncbi:Rha family transcriptional regulator [Fusobacterium ulcerans]|uniref:Rha family transcriptional regulator n=1 Tax=Fusobacterium ulcerans TaxID=861 RepID=UPI002E777B23|nr:Rha family transcriptional regulator [Fusobacterium ulcerans]MEE0138833.1 Rha family transcriptional regulator [Fusobacterium ulcerans]
MNELLKAELEFDEKLGYFVSSRTIADGLGKRHDNVLRDLEQILETSNVSSLIISSFYEVKGQKRKYREYKLTKDGFTLYMFHIQGFTEFKMAYINRFNEMESFIKETHTKLKEITVDKKFDWLIKRVRDRTDRTEYIENLISYLFEVLEKEYKKISEDINFKIDFVSKHFLDFKTDEEYNISKEKLPVLVEVEETLTEKIKKSEKGRKSLEQKKLTTKE